LNIANNLSSGVVSLASTFNFKPNTISSSAVNSAITLFNNITTGSIGIANGVTTGSISIANALSSGTLNICTSGGNINIGNATNSSTTDNGCCKINKLQVGSGNVIREIRYGVVPANSSSPFKFEPAFPSGSVPIILTGGISASTNNSRVINVLITNLTYIGFSFKITYVNFSAGSGTSNEAFSYIAIAP
jgi:hypothetical protein